MRTLAAVAFVALSGCWYDRPNPWRTEGDVAELQYETEQDWALVVEKPFEPPQSSRAAFYDPDLEAFRDTVLASADMTTLRDMLGKSAAKLAMLQARQTDLLKQDDLSRREQLREVNENIRIEWLRGRMIQARIDQGEIRRY